MANSPVRRLGILDAGVLIAATASALAPIRGLFEAHYQSLVVNHGRPIHGAIALGCDSPDGLALLVVDRHGGPQPEAPTPSLALCREPTRDGCRPVGDGLGWALPPQGLCHDHHVAGHRGRLPAFFTMALGHAVPAIVGGITVAWLALACATGHWRAEPTWLDRFGRTLGAVWIGLEAIIWISGFVMF